jgi:hypothetical protein
MDTGVQTPSNLSMTRRLVLHSATVEPEPLALVPVVMLATAGAAVLLGVALAAFVRRQSRPYLLIVGAFAALFGRSAIAGIAVVGHLSRTDHHLIEHGFDVVLVALTIAAVYHARTVNAEPDTDP